MTSSTPPLTDAQLAERLEEVRRSLGLSPTSLRDVTLRLAADRLTTLAQERDQALAELARQQDFMAREVPESERLMGVLRGITEAMGLPEGTMWEELAGEAKTMRQGVLELMERVSALELASLRPAWQPIETLPYDYGTRACFFWIVPKTAEESYLNTSGRPIAADFQPYCKLGRRGEWNALSKATHWMPLPPAPPSSPATREPETT